jgi:hypothetical protein
MTGKQRALAALRFEPTDRIPILGGFVAHAEWLRRNSGLDPWADPYGAAVAAAKAVSVDLIIQIVTPKPREASVESTDPGRESQFSRQGEIPFKSPEDVRDHIAAFPSPEEVRAGFDLETSCDAVIATWRDYDAKAGDDLLILPYAQASDVGFMYYSQFGYENYYMALALYPDVMAKLYRNSAEYARCRNEAFARAVRQSDLPPFTYIGQDICDNSGPMVSLATLDELYFPQLKYALEPLTDAGVKKVWHSDGNINPILERLLDCGIDGFQGLQEDTYLPEHQRVHLERLAGMTARTGDPLILFGSVSVREVLPFGTAADVERDVERCMDTCAGRGGYFLAPTSTAGPDIPCENLDAFFRHGKEYGQGK